MARPVFTQVNLVVGDLPAVAAFYRRLGLEVPEPEGDHTEVDGDGGAVFELDGPPSANLWNASTRADPGATPIVLGFSVASRDAVDELYADLTAAGHPGVQPPFDAWFGARYAIVADPAGNQVGLMSPQDASMRSWPPAASPDP